MNFCRRSGKESCREGFLRRKGAPEKAVVVHTAGSVAEAMVIRGLLQSAGIVSPGSFSTDPFPMREPPEGTHGTEIVVLESHAGEARRLIAEYLRDNKSAESEDSGEKDEN
jgi:hypothetical protein